MKNETVENTRVIIELSKDHKHIEIVGKKVDVLFIITNLFLEYSNIKDMFLEVFKYLPEVEKLYKKHK